MIDITVTTRTTWYLLHGVFLWCGAFGLLGLPQATCVSARGKERCVLASAAITSVCYCGRILRAVWILGFALRVALVLCPCVAVMAAMLRVPARACVRALACVLHVQSCTCTIGDTDQALLVTITTRHDTCSTASSEKWAQCGGNRCMRNDLEWHAAF